MNVSKGKWGILVIWQAENTFNSINKLMNTYYIQSKLHGH